MNRILALWQTAIGKKVAMAVSGILLVLFLVSHMISNVTVLIDPKHLDDYAAWLRSFGPLLWVARLGLLALAVIHIAAAIERRVHEVVRNRHVRDRVDDVHAVPDHRAERREPAGVRGVV